MDRQAMNEVVLQVRQVLRLEDWVITLEEDDSILHGYVSFERETKRAAILYNPETITAFHIRHEMFHILMYDMSFLASNGRSVEVMEMYNLFEERVCNILAEAIDF